MAGEALHAGAQYLLLRGTGAVAAFRIEEGGSLTQLEVEIGGLPVADGAFRSAAF